MGHAIHINPPHLAALGLLTNNWVGTLVINNHDLRVWTFPSEINAEFGGFILCGHSVCVDARYIQLVRLRL